MNYVAREAGGPFSTRITLVALPSTPLRPSCSVLLGFDRARLASAALAYPQCDEL